MVINPNYMNNINKISTQKTTPAIQRPSQNQGGFESILQDKIQQNTGLKFSKHAELRLQARNINLTQTQKDKLNDAVNKADVKGVKDSLVVMDNMAFVVNIKNKTVITACNSNELKENVFTNIDGAVFA